MKYRSPEGQTGTVTAQIVGKALIYAHPGELREVHPYDFIFYPDDGSLPIILTSLEGYEVAE
jgi:hypothetical protein